MPDRGKYIVLEGDEGAGKTTQLEPLRKRIRSELFSASNSQNVIKLREPGGDPAAEQIREILKYSPHEMTPIAQTLGFLTARANMLELVVKPKLESGCWVLTDRNSISTLIYQGHVQKLIPDPYVETPTAQGFLSALSWVDEIQKPDLIVVLDIPFEVSKERVQKRDEKTDRFESFDEPKRRAINQWYRHYGDPSFARTTMVDGNQSEQEVHDQIWAHIEPLLPKEAS